MTSGSCDHAVQNVAGGQKDNTHHLALQYIFMYYATIIHFFINLNNNGPVLHCNWMCKQLWGWIFCHILYSMGTNNTDRKKMTLCQSLNSDGMKAPNIVPWTNDEVQTS